jgi:hypothetical protein
MSFVPNIPPPPQVANPQLKQWIEQLQQMVNWYLSNLQTQLTALTAVVSGLSTGGGNSVTVAVDFSTGADMVRTTVTGQTWVAADSEIVATLAGGPSSRSVEEGLVEDLTFAIENLVVGTGFDLVTHAPYGKAYGIFNVYCVGV